MVSELKGYARLVCEQPPYNLLDRRIENEIVPLCPSAWPGADHLVTLGTRCSGRALFQRDELAG